MVEEKELPREPQPRIWMFFVRGAYVLAGAAVVVWVVAVVVINLFSGLIDTREAWAVDQERQLATALRLYERDCEHLPTSEQGLDALLSKPGDCPHWKPYLEEDAVPLDPWEHRFDYVASGLTYEIRSAGRDGRFGTADDVVSAFPRDMTRSR